jgi:phospholipase/carboxylesterase
MSIHKIENTVLAGLPLEKAKRVMILTHGRGASAQSILSLAQSLYLADFALLAPNATDNTWYPYSFIAPESENEPYLSSALLLVGDLVKNLQSQGFRPEQIYFAGFSQGACLISEFLGRNANRYGGALIFTGGLVGQDLKTERYQGDFAGMPIFIGSGNPDFHVPVERVYATSNIFREMGAVVEEVIYPNIPHTIVADEIERANRLLRSANH